MQYIELEPDAIDKLRPVVGIRRGNDIMAECHGSEKHAKQKGQAEKNAKNKPDQLSALLPLRALEFGGVQNLLVFIHRKAQSVDGSLYIGNLRLSASYSTTAFSVA